MNPWIQIQDVIMGNRQWMWSPINWSKSKTFNWYSLLILKFSWANFGCHCKVTRMVEITYPVSYMNQGHDFKFFCGLSVNLVELLIYKSLCLCKFLTVTQLEIAKYKQLRVGQDKYTRMSVG